MWDYITEPIIIFLAIPPWYFFISHSIFVFLLLNSHLSQCIPPLPAICWILTLIKLYNYPPNQLNNFVWRFLSAMAFQQFHHNVNKMMARKGNHFQMTLFQVGEWFHSFQKKWFQTTNTNIMIIMGLHRAGMGGAHYLVASATCSGGNSWPQRPQLRGV